MRHFPPVIAAMKDCSLKLFGQKYRNLSWISTAKISLENFFLLKRVEKSSNTFFLLQSAGERNINFFKERVHTSYQLLFP